MPVTNEHVAAMRAMLSGKIDEYQRMFDELEQANRLDGYEALLSAAFLEAVDRRFGEKYEAAEIVRYIADVRARYSETGTDLDSRVAEQLIHAVLGDGSTDGLTDQAIAQVQVLLLGDLVAAKHPTDAELDEFMTEVRAIADESLALE